LLLHEYLLTNHLVLPPVWVEVGHRPAVGEVQEEVAPLRLVKASAAVEEV
jgi:hypothetical protein